MAGARILPVNGSRSIGTDASGGRPSRARLEASRGAIASSTKGLYARTRNIGMAQDDPDHVQGVDFESINPVLEDISYPVTAGELREEFGDEKLGRTNADPISVDELFQYMGDETFESADGVRQMILAQMPRDSEGRAGYSDRGGSSPSQTEAAEEAAEQDPEDLEDGPATDTETTQQ